MTEAYPILLAGQRITASLLSSMQCMTARKTADTSRTSVTVVSADPHLQFTLAANGVYTWWGWLKYDGDSTVGAGDLAVDFSGPSGILGEWVAIGAGVDRVIGATDAASPAFTVNTQAATGYMLRTETNDVTAARTYGTVGTGNTPLTLDLHGTIRVASTGGVFSLDWAQRASSATATTLYTDSWINMLRVA